MLATLLILAGAIGFVILAISKLNLHPFLALLLAAYGLTFATGLPAEQVAQAISSGFGSTLTSIGLVIVTGTIIGTVLEKSGATLTIANAIFFLLGRIKPTWGIGCIGYVVSIAVFCDSGFVILASLNRAIAARSKVPLGALSIALAVGLLSTHALVPPTPGPVAAAATLGATNMLLVIGTGLVVALPVALGGVLWANWLWNRGWFNEAPTAPAPAEHEDQLDSMFKQPLPHFVPAILPIALPILLLMAGTISEFWFGKGALGFWPTLFAFLGAPVNALTLGVLSCGFLLPNFTSATLNGWVGHALKDAAAILVVTATGGTLGAIIKLLPLKDYLNQGLADLGGGGPWMGFGLAFGLAAIMKSAQGSSTVAMVTVSAMVAPLLEFLGLSSEAGRALLMAAVGAGALTVSHANDSFFWVVSQFGGLSPALAYRTHTLGTLLAGLIGLGTVMLLSLVML
ncbi:MAG: GntP family permease [Bernardetiaceae bacterium]|jgi:GntP family gluconate:H+ symporter|nr:GntP family permease [Bernardetiaceae bacterium]